MESSFLDTSVLQKHEDKPGRQLKRSPGHVLLPGIFPLWSTSGARVGVLQLPSPQLHNSSSVISAHLSSCCTPTLILWQPIRTLRRKEFTPSISPVTASYGAGWIASSITCSWKCCVPSPGDIMSPRETHAKSWKPITVLIFGCPTHGTFSCALSSLVLNGPSNRASAPFPWETIPQPNTFLCQEGFSDI